MLNNEEPINLMFRTSPQLLTTSSYDSIRRQNYGGIILLQRAPHLCTSGSYTQPPKYALSDHSTDPSVCKRSEWRAYYETLNTRVSGCAEETSHTHRSEKTKIPEYV